MLMFGNIGPWQLLIILAIILVLFGSSKLPGLGSAMGKTIKEFKNSVGDPEGKKAAKAKADADALEETKTEVIEMSKEDK
ncbi:MAG: twin-arginine translocase TatA/TatE family subunit [Clostridiales bacterium]|nr:twin-arginine translocase TatA/TatE family subunit [Clostridiales bacterium]